MFTKPKSPVTYVEFMSGPLDGHRLFLVGAKPISRAAIPIHANLYRALDGQPKLDQAPLTSVAFYQAKFGENGVVRYDHMASCAPSDVADSVHRKKIK